jgi:hypothetical protein
MVHRIFTTNWHEPYYLAIYLVMYLKYGSDELSKEEFDQRYYSPPGIVQKFRDLWRRSE